MTEATPAKRYRVVQWATGNVGGRSLRHAIQHPDFDLIGVWVHSAAKVGQDAGVLAGLAPIGVKAVGTREEVIALRPDCVLYMPHQFDADDVCAILESGANVVSTRMELQNPAALDPALTTRLEAACQKGNSSVHASGSSPGFVTEALPIVLASIQRRIDLYRVDEFADLSSRDSPEMIFQIMGFGQAPGPVSEGQLYHMQMGFGPSLQLLATALGRPIERFTVAGTQGIARADITIAAGVVPKGTVAATRSTLTGYHGGKPLVEFRTTWFVSPDCDTPGDEPWEFRSESGWRVLMLGDCPLKLEITFPVAPEDYAEMTPGLTANRPINAVPYVCDAPAGIVTTADLPQVIARLG